MQINVTVEGLDGIDLNTVVGDEIAYYNPETEETEYRPRTIADIVADRLTKRITEDGRWGEARQQFATIRDEEIRKAVKPIVAEALAGPIRKTNSYGEPTGAATTMRELIIAEVGKALHEPLDKYNRSGPTFLHKAVADTVRTMLDAELKAVFDAEKAKIVAAVKDKAADLIADAVRQGVGR